MPSITIDPRFCGPPNSGNGGFVCGLVAEHIGRSAEVTLRAPPPLGRQLSIVAGTDGGAELPASATVLAIGRGVHLDVSGVPGVSIAIQP